MKITTGREIAIAYTVTQTPIHSQYYIYRIIYATLQYISKYTRGS